MRSVSVGETSRCPGVVSHPGRPSPVGVRSETPPRALSSQHTLGKGLTFEGDTVCL